jgi:predicted NUDIX family NTP pyrophosphohydrolase
MKHLKPFSKSADVAIPKITCGIYLFDSNNQLLIQHPTNFRPTVWGIPKGRINADETNEFDVAKREMLEESGVNLDDYNIIHQEEFDMVKYNDTNKYLKSFFVKVDFDLSDFKFYCDSMVYRNGVPKFPEVDEWKWVTLDEARKIFSGDRMTDFQSGNLDRCEEILKQI